MDTLIDAGRVVEILRDCLFTSEEMPGDTEVPGDAVVVEGIVNTYGFQPQRLESHRDEITKMLQGLPWQFRPTNVGGDGGWSFLNACEDANGELWTGEHRTVEALLVLGIGLGLAEWLLPKEIWSALPGGMPYVVVKV
jgi:hypothetical protein